MIENYKAVYMNPGTCYFREVQFNAPDGCSPVSVRFTSTDVVVLGDFGCWVFKGNIRCPLQFFSGNHTNPGYWAEKLEAAPQSHYDRPVDENAIHDALLAEAEYHNINVKNLEGLCSGRDSVESWIDTLTDMKEALDWRIDNEELYSIVSNSTEPDKRYLIVCEFVQKAANLIMEREPTEAANG